MMSIRTNVEFPGLCISNAKIQDKLNQTLSVSTVAMTSNPNASFNYKIT